MSFPKRFVNSVLRTFFRLFFTIDRSELAKVPRSGPLMMIVNHTSVFEGPMLYVFLQPRAMHALAKKELWKNPFTRSLMKLWGSIPVDRGNVDRKAMDAIFAVLDRGEIFAIAPEGTRSKDGTLQRGKGGIAFIAYRNRTPMVPIAVTGFDRFKRNLLRFRRTRITIRVGEVFRPVGGEGRLDAAGRQTLADEMMVRIAALMDERHRGYYRTFDPTFTLTEASPPQG
ncbi:MAG: 1-acyl-sn-glycerol-3-phosphate acyltransferase [Spirochaetales bacterium]|nr:1-acyl-sn-glycerol-3-phosphate acyltransferase [Spirochaetales bacterium]